MARALSSAKQHAGCRERFSREIRQSVGAGQGTRRGGVALAAEFIKTLSGLLIDAPGRELKCDPPV